MAISPLSFEHPQAKAKVSKELAVTPAGLDADMASYWEAAGKAAAAAAPVAEVSEEAVADDGQAAAMD